MNEPAGGLWQQGSLRLAFDRAGNGRPLVFGHGLGGDRTQIAALLGSLAGVDRLTPECRGHGLSDPGAPVDLTLSTLAQDALGLAADLGWGEAVWGGISMGAAVALHAAVLRPSAVRALVLVRPAWTAGPAPAHLAIMGRLGRWMRTLPIAAVRQALLNDRAYDDVRRVSPDNATSLLGQLDAVDLQVRGMLLQRIGTQPLALTRGTLTTIAVPVLIVATEEDALHPVAAAQDLAAALPDARLTIVTSKSQNAGENRVETVAAVQGFLDGLA